MPAISLEKNSQSLSSIHINATLLNTHKQKGTIVNFFTDKNKFYMSYIHNGHSSMNLRYSRQEILAWVRIQGCRIRKKSVALAPVYTCLYIVILLFNFSQCNSCDFELLQAEGLREGGMSQCSKIEKLISLYKFDSLRAINNYDSIIISK